MKTTKFLLLAFALLSIFAKCKDELPVDPNSFYFRCKVDGVTYIPSNCANCKTSDLVDDTVLIIGGNNGFESVFMGINDPLLGPKNYLLNGVIGRQGGYDNSPVVADIFKTDMIRTGNLTVYKLDKLNRIVEGNFSFSAYNSVQNKTVSVTEGVFRLNLKL
ncbi:MAG: DUF6252 family protein [Ferruginibacter sp.]